MTRLEGRESTTASEPDGMMKARPRPARPAYDPEVLVIPADVGGPYDNRPDYLLREFFRDSDRRSGGRPPDQFQVRPPSGARQTPGSPPPSRAANSGGSSAKGRSGGSAPAAQSGGSGSKPPSGSSGSRPSQGGGSSGRASQGGGSKGGGGHSGGGGKDK